MARVRAAICVVVSVSLLTACKSAPTIKLSSPILGTDSYSALLREVENVANAYDDYARQMKSAVLPYGIGMALLAAGSVAAAVFSHGAARGNILAGIGIAAGTASVLWNAVRPEEKRDAYFQAEDRARCVVLAGRNLGGANAEGAKTQLDDDVDDLEESIGSVQSQVDTLLPKADSALKRGIVASSQLALPPARTAYTSGSKEQRAFDSRDSEVRTAISAIDAAAREQSRTIVVVFNSAQKTIGDTVTSAQKGATGNGPPLAAALPPSGALPQRKDEFRTLQDATAEMNALAARVARHTSFTDAINAIHGCIVLSGKAKDAASDATDK